MLLVKTLRSSTFRLALIAIAAFGLIVAAMIAYVYVTTLTYLRGRVGDLAVDLISRSASRRGKKIPLLPREFQLLEYLVRNEGRVVSRAMLLQHVWDLHFDPSTNIIDVYVGRVRRKVDDSQAYPLIHTIRGIGYCLRAPG